MLNHSLPRCLFAFSMVFVPLACSPKHGGGERRTDYAQVPEGAQDKAAKPTKANSKDRDKPDVTDSKKPTDQVTSEQAGQGACYKGDAAVCNAERQIFELTNKVRAGRGLEPLTFSPKISFVARGWSSEQADGDFISHAGFPGQRQSNYQREFGQSFNSNAENVAMTGGSTSPAEDFVDMWVGSIGHLRNMLGNYKVLGVGLAQSPNGAWYATQIFGDE